MSPRTPLHKVLDDIENAPGHDDRFGILRAALRDAFDSGALAMVNALRDKHELGPLAVGRCGTYVFVEKLEGRP